MKVSYYLFLLKLKDLKKIENPENEQKRNSINVEADMFEEFRGNETCVIDNGEQPTTSNTGIERNTECKSCKEKDKHYKTLIQQNHILRGLLTDILTEVKEIKNTRQVAGNQDNAEHRFFKTPGINFPIDTDEEFQHLEQLLENEQEFENAVKELHKLGGSSAYDHAQFNFNKQPNPEIQLVGKKREKAVPHFKARQTVDKICRTGWRKIPKGNGMCLSSLASEGVRQEGIQLKKILNKNK